MRSSDRKVEKGETENSSTLQLELYKYIPADPHERVDTDEVAGEPKIRLRVPGDLRLKNIQGQEKGHRRLGTHLHKEAPPSIFPTDRVQDDGILADLGVADDYEFSLFAHLATTCIFSGSLFCRPLSHCAIARRALPRCEISFFCSSVMSAAVSPGYSSGMNIGS